MQCVCVCVWGRVQSSLREPRFASPRSARSCRSQGLSTGSCGSPRSRRYCPVVAATASSGSRHRPSRRSAARLMDDPRTFRNCTTGAHTRQARDHLPLGCVGQPSVRDEGRATAWGADRLLTGRVLVELGQIRLDLRQTWGHPGRRNITYMLQSSGCVLSVDLRGIRFCRILWNLLFMCLCGDEVLNTHAHAVCAPRRIRQTSG